MKKIKKIGVVGAGTMGSGIAQKIAQEGIEVYLLDREETFLTNGIERIKQTLKESVDKRIFDETYAKNTLNLIKPTLFHRDFEDCDFVIEAVFEDEKVKKNLFQKMDEVCKESTIFATNTSSLSVTELAESVKRKKNFVGMHFFYHPVKNRFLEIIPSRYTSIETLEKVLLLSKILGKITVVVKDTPGFVVNRFFVPWLNEAVRILDEDLANIPTIEKIFKDIFIIPFGPFSLMNLTGIPIAYHSAVSLTNKLGEFYKPSKSLEERTQKGGLWEIERGEIELSRSEEIRERILGVVFLLVSQIVDEKIAKIEDVEKGAKIALRWRYGPFEFMNREGIENSKKYVKKIGKKYGIEAPRFLMEYSLDKWKIRHVHTVIKNGIGHIILSKPETMNALDFDLLSELEEHFAKLENDPSIKKITVEGEGKAFVAGADIKFFIKNIETKNLDKIVEFTKYGHHILNKIEKSKKPVICKLTGIALGGGSELALVCSSIIAIDKSYIAFPETGIGIYPGLGGTQRLPKLIGKELAKYFIFTGFPIDAQTGKKLGIFEEILSLEDMENWIEKKEMFVEKYQGEFKIPEKLKIIKEQFSDENVESLLRGEILDEKNPLLQKIRKAISYKAPIALRIANKLIDEGFKLPLEQGLKLEINYLTEIFSTQDAYEGLKSIGKKRPEFKGR